MNRRRILCITAAALSAAIGWFLPDWILPENPAFSAVCIAVAMQEILLLLVPAAALFAMNGDPVAHVRALVQKVNAYFAGMTMLAAVSFSLTGALITAIFYMVLTQVGINPALPPSFVPKNLGELALAGLSMAAVTAVCEEVFFRGLIQGSLRKRLSENASMWVTAILFALLHFSLLGFPLILFVGLILSRLMAQRGILLPILFHALYNFAIILINYSGTTPNLGAMILCLVIFVFASRLLFLDDKKEVSHEM